MKKYILALFVVSLLLVSCNDFLDDANQDGNVKLKDRLDPEQQDQFAADVYGEANRQMRHWILYSIVGIRSDDYDNAAVGDQSPLIAARQFNYSAFEGFWGLNESFRIYYNVILRANATLITLDELEPLLRTDEQKMLNPVYKAQMRFLRAYSYFYLTRLFGDVPIILTTDADDLINAKKSSRAEIYQFINDELDACINDLPMVRPNEMKFKGQVTGLSALALKAKANADLNQWVVVEEATDKIIQNGRMSLYPDFNNLFKLSGRLSNESFFELQYTTAFGNVGDYLPEVWFQFQAPKFASNNPFPTGSGWGFMTPSDGIINFSKNRGETVRNTTTFLFAGTTTPEGDILAPVTSRRDSVYSGKAYFPSREMAPNITTPGHGNNIRLLRYADILLLNAEAKVRNGKNGDAAFNLVRTRAQMPTLSNVTLDQVLDERRMELATEWGERFFDLVRTGKAASTLPGFVVGKSEFYPIPLAQRDLNPNLR